MDKLHIVKVGGNIIENKKNIQNFLLDFAKLRGYKILVHGGGKEASKISQKIGVPFQIINGRRITDAANLDIITMVYAGKINKNIVSQLQAIQCNALGLSGADGNSILAKKRSPKPIDFGFVGDVTKVNISFFKILIDQGITPVCCAISHDGDGQLLNTNADTIAASLAGSMATEFEVTLSYCFEKNGVLENIEDESSLITKINLKTYKSMIKKGLIHSGMIPKIENCFNALRKGVNQVRIGSPKIINEAVQYTKIEL